MVDTSRRIDLSGSDVIVNSIAFPTPGSIPTGGTTGRRVIDTNGQTPTLITATGTLTAAQMGAGMACYTGGAGTVTFDSATNIVAYLNNNYSGAQINDVIQFDVTAAATGPTIALGAGNTAATGTVSTLAANSQRTFIIQVTNVTTPACTVYS